MTPARRVRGRRWSFRRAGEGRNTYMVWHREHDCPKRGGAPGRPLFRCQPCWETSARIVHWGFLLDLRLGRLTPYGRGPHFPGPPSPRAGGLSTLDNIAVGGVIAQRVECARHPILLLELC